MGRGKELREHIDRLNGRIEDGHPPIGLWQNCYDELWLQSITPYRRRALKMINKDYPFEEPKKNQDKDNVNMDSSLDGGNSESEVEEGL